MDITGLLITLPILIISAILHEVMHGFVADKLGDPTARVMGRLTLNPIPHIDPIMSIGLPALLLLIGSPILFGAAKPVPVNPIYFRDPKKDMAITALAGPLTNILIALIAAALLRVVPDVGLLGTILFGFVQFNLLLAILNLIPIPPLDGSKVIASILPDNIASSYLSIERYGTFILFFLLLSPGPYSLGAFMSRMLTYSLQLLGF
jgi:Zn-dependent protease